MNKKTRDIILGIIGLVYIINPTAGIFELIPDNIPIVGNLDEFAASYLVIKAIKILFSKKNAQD